MSRNLSKSRTVYKHYTSMVMVPNYGENPQAHCTSSIQTKVTKPTELSWASTKVMTSVRSNFFVRVPETANKQVQMVLDSDK